jgi:hypothetical protein
VRTIESARAPPIPAQRRTSPRAFYANHHVVHVRIIAIATDLQHHVQLAGEQVLPAPCHQVHAKTIERVYLERTRALHRFNQLLLSVKLLVADAKATRTALEQQRLAP